MRRLTTVAVSFSAAIFISCYFIPASRFLLCAAITALLSAVCLFFKGDLRLRIFLVLLGITSGFLWFFGYQTVFYSPAESLAGSSGPVSAIVTDYPVKTDYGSKVDIKVQKDGYPSVKTLLYLYDDMPDLEPGYKIEVDALLSLANKVNGSESDVFTAKGYFLFASKKGTLTVTDKSSKPVYLPRRLAKATEDKIAAVFPADVNPLMQALLMGNTDSINKDPVTMGALSATGVTHIISVSGMNVAFLMGILQQLIRKKRTLALTGIPVVICFMAMIGFTPPVTRAGIMQLFLLTAPLFKRQSDAITSLTTSLLLILLFNPFAAASASLQLSFVSTLGIILFTGRIYTSLEQPIRRCKLYSNRFGKPAARFVIASLSTTFGALVFTVPLSAAYFGCISIVAPLTNLLVIWAVNAAFCGGLLACLLGFVFQPAGIAAAAVAALPARFVLWSVGALSKLPLAAVYTSNTAVVCWILYTYTMFAVFFSLRGKILQLVIPACLAAVSLCIILQVTAVSSDTYDLTFTALNIGQGQCLVATSGPCTAVIDCGSSSGEDAGDIAYKYLSGHGRSKIDLIILTHFHADHADGVEELIERMDVSAIAIPDPDIDDGGLSGNIIALARSRNIDIIYVTRNLSVSFGRSVLKLFAPLGSEGENERGLTILCSENDFDVLVTGDMNSNIEELLIKKVRLPDIEVLVAGHHGSKSSTCEELLDAVKPEVALISVGRNNYGQPSGDVIYRLVSKGIKVYRTDQMGNITINAR